MTEETDKFVEEMLKKAKEKGAAKPQTRTEGVDREEVEELTGEVLGWKLEKKKKKE